MEADESGRGVAAGCVVAAFGGSGRGETALLRTAADLTLSRVGSDWSEAPRCRVGLWFCPNPPFKEVNRK